jgi:hypothetical protein
MPDFFAKKMMEVSKIVPMGFGSIKDSSQISIVYALITYKCRASFSGIETQNKTRRETNGKS